MYLRPITVFQTYAFRYSCGFFEARRNDDNLSSSSQQREWFEIQIPEGSYHPTDIAETLKNAMKRSGHDDESIKISANTKT